jgi:hypothetical protein
VGFCHAGRNNNLAFDGGKKSIFVKLLKDRARSSIILIQPEPERNAMHASWSGSDSYFQIFSFKVANLIRLLLAYSRRPMMR